MRKNRIVGWPQSQLLLNKEGFFENCSLINSREGILTYGSCAYLVDEEWYEKYMNGELKDMTDEEVESRADELDVCYDNSVIFEQYRK